MKTSQSNSPSGTFSLNDIVKAWQGFSAPSPPKGPESFATEPEPRSPQPEPDPPGISVATVIPPLVAPPLPESGVPTLVMGIAFLASGAYLSSTNGIAGAPYSGYALLVFSFIIVIKALSLEFSQGRRMY